MSRPEIASYSGPPTSQLYGARWRSCTDGELVAPQCLGAGSRGPRRSVVARVAPWCPILQDAHVEFWLHGFAVPGRVAETARRAEAWGFAGLLLADSQNLTADIWVELCLAAAATSRLRIGPGVTNPITRHIAVTAAAAATLQHESNGRVSLGVGQGDS